MIRCARGSDLFGVRCFDTSLVEAEAPLQILKAPVVTQAVKDRIVFDCNPEPVAFLGSSSDPGDCLLFVAYPRVSCRVCLPET